MKSLRLQLVLAVGFTTALCLMPVATAETASQDAATQQAAPTQQELLKKLEAMQAKIDRLESQVAQQAQRLQPVATSQPTAADAVMTDAEHRSRFFATDGGFVGGWNPQKQQFYLASEDGNFYFHPIAIFQVRGIANYREDAKQSGDSSAELGFEIRRAKFGFDGNIFTPDLTYKMQWQDNATGSPSLEYGWVQYVFAHQVLGNADLAIRAGQAKDIVFKEEFVGDQLQLMAERSLANTLVGGNAPPLNLVQGVDFLVIGKDNPLHAEFELHDGFGSGNTNFTQPHGPGVIFPQTPSEPPTNPGNWGASARVDYKFFGDWIDTTDFTGQISGKHDLLDVGAGVDYTDAQGATAIRYTLDAQYQIAHKLVMFVAGYGDYFEFRNTAPGVAGTQNNFGAQVEGGYSLTREWQLTARYSISKLDNAFQTAGTSTFQEYSIGANWYGPNGAWGNHAKFTVDLNYLPDGTPAAAGLDYLASPGDQQFVVRTQFQLWL